MKLDTLEKNDVQVISDENNEQIEFDIDKEDEWIIFKSFTNYSDPIGSMIREIVSNAYDAHIEAGIDKNIEVEIEEEDDLMGTSPVLNIKDFGTGLSPDVMKNIYSKFGKSTKRDRNDAIGAFGFGAKSPLSYTDMFELITIVDGVKYHYAIHKGEKKPVIDKMGEWETDENNGTTVRIYIKSGDKHKFIESLKKNLQYFNNITYINCGLENDYKIIKGKHFIFNTQFYDSSLHICLGKVRYPIDTDIIRYYNVPIGLYFDIGEIPVVWNREGIEYTDKAVEKIKDKIDLVREEIQDIHDKQIEDIDNLDSFINYKSSNNLIVYKDEDEEYSTNVSDFIEITKTYPKYKTLTIRRDYYLYNTYKVESCTKYQSNRFDINDNLIIIPKGQGHSSLKDEYIKEINGHNQVKIIRKINKKKAVRDLLDSFFDSYFSKYPYDTEKETRQNAIREAYQLYDEIIEWIESHAENYNDIEPTEEFIEKWEEERRKEKERKKEEFYYLDAVSKGSFNSHRISGEKLIKRFGKDVVIYGFQEHRKALRQVEKIISKEYSYSVRDHIHIIQISIKNERVIKEVLGNKAYHVQNVDKIPFMKRIGNKYNYVKWKNDLYDVGLDIGSKPNRIIPSYITPNEPTLEEKRKFYKEIGEKIKYPLLQYLSSIQTPPEEEIEKYKKRCPNHHVNSILIGKKYLKHYEDKRTEKQQSSDSDSGK